MADAVSGAALPLPPASPAALQRLLSSPPIPSFHSFASSSPASASSAQPLIDHALFMLSLSQRLASSEGEADRAVEMREDALKLLVMGEEMRKAEEIQHDLSNHSSPRTSPRPWQKGGGAEDDEGEEGGHLIPPAYTFGLEPTFQLPTTSLVPVTASASASAPNSSLVLLPSSSPDPSALAMSSSLSTLLVEADAVLVRLHGKYRDYIAPLVDEGIGAVQRLTETEEARVMVEEGRQIVGQWREWMGSREGELMLHSLVQLLTSQEVSAALLSNLSLAHLLPLLTGEAGEAAPQSTSSPTLPPPASTSALSVAPSAASSSPFSLSSLPSVVHSFLLAHPALHLLLMRAQSALLSPDSASAAELDGALASFSSRVHDWLTDLSSTSQSSALSLHGRPQLLSSPMSSVLKDVSAPVLRLLKSPELVFSEGVRLLLRKERREEVLEGAKALIITQLSTALSSLTFPAVQGSTPSFSYAIEPFSLSSFHLHADDLQLTSSANSLSLTIQHVSAETRHVGWQCSQLVFPYMQGGGTMDLRLREASMLLTVKVRAEEGALLLDALSFHFPSLDFHVGGSGLSSVYNLLLALFGPIVRAEMEKALSVWSRARSEQLLDVVNEYGKELIKKMWGSAAQQSAAKGDDEADGEREGGRADGAKEEEKRPAAPAAIKAQLIREVAADAVVDAVEAALTSAADDSAPATSPSPAVSAASTSTSSPPLTATAPVLVTPPKVRAVAAAPSSQRLSTPSSSASTSSAFSSPLTPSSSSPFLSTVTPPLLCSFHDTASGW